MLKILLEAHKNTLLRNVKGDYPNANERDRGFMIHGANDLAMCAAGLITDDIRLKIIFAKLLDANRLEVFGASEGFNPRKLTLPEYNDLVLELCAP